MRIADHPLRFAGLAALWLGLAFAALRPLRGCPLPPVEPTATGCPKCDCGCDNLSGGQPPAGSQVSLDGVRYFNGDLCMTADDLDQGVSPAPLWGHSRVYCNAIEGHWFIQQLPHMNREGTTIVIVFDQIHSFWFDLTGGVYVARYGAKQTLVHDPSTNVYRMTEPDGGFWEFFDFTSSMFPAGHFSRRVAAGGQSATATGTTAKNVNEVQLKLAGSGTVYEQYDYGYVTAGGAKDQMTSATLSRYNSTGGTLAPVRQATYDYYSTGSPCGMNGDLRTALCRSNSGGGWVGTDTYYYRYYTAGATGGFPHGMKFAFRPFGYSNLQAALGHAPTDSDADAAIAPYACFYFEYMDSAHPYAITKETVFGQSQTYTFAYTSGGGGPNGWQMKTVEQELSLSGTATIPLYTNTVYTNPIGQVQLTDLEDTSGTWCTYRSYDPSYRLLLAAEPSAVAGYGLSGGNWDSAAPTGTSTGLVHEFNYYPTTTGSETTAGGALGYQAYAFARQAGSNLAASFSNPGAIMLPLSGGTATVLGYTQYYAHSGVLAIVGTAAGVTGSTQTIFPVATHTTYSDSSGSAGAAVFSYSYSWALSGGATGPALLQARQENTLLPAISSSQNGPGGTGATRLQYFDNNGSATWQMNELGRVSHSAYDPVTGSLTETILDISSSTAGPLTQPPGWTIPANGLSVTSDYQYEILGRPVQSLGPAYNNDQNQNVRTAAWTVYDDPNRILYAAGGYQASGSTTTVNPVSVRMYDNGCHLLQSIAATSGGTATTTSGSFLLLSSADLTSLGTTQSNFCRWTVNQYAKSRLASTAVYFAIPASGTGTVGTAGSNGVVTGNFSLSQYGYETLGSSSGAAAWFGRPNRTQSPGGTVRRSVYDTRANIVSSWVGTNDGSASDADPTGGGAAGNNMLKVAVNQFDGGSSGGDDNLTQSSLYVSGSGARITGYGFDWRDRRVTATSNDGLNNGGTAYIAQTVLDNLSQATGSNRYVTSASPSNLIATSSASFDLLGRAYQRQSFAVDITSGSIGNALTSGTWYDLAGNVLMSKMAGSGATSFTKTAYDGLMRSTSSYSGYCPSGGTSATAPTLVPTADVVFQQNETTYDAASNVIFAVSRSRLAASSGTATGGLDVSGGTLARSSYTAAWFDGIGRSVEGADYGINGGTAMTIANRTGTAPASGALVLVGTTVFNARGEPFETIDPKGQVNQQVLDNAARTITTLENVVTGGTAADQNITVMTAYTPDGMVATVSASNAATGLQVTLYAYGAAPPASDAIARTDLLKAVIYPDSGDTFTMTGGTPTFTNGVGGYNRVQYTYNQLGEQVGMTDQNTTVHAYGLDGLGRPTTDSVILAAGSKVDGTVKQIARSYEIRGMLKGVTSFSNSAGTGTPVNDVLMLYNSFGQLSGDYQAHGGSASSGGSPSPSVQYAYADGTANTIRTTGVTYPTGGRTITFNYNSGADDTFGRLSYLANSGGSLAAINLSQFSYLGLGRIVTENYAEPDATLDYSGGTPAYAGLDNFDRVAQQPWLISNFIGTLDQFNYTYDRASNRLTRQNVTGTLKDEQYTYDHKYRLNRRMRGTLDTSSGTIMGTPVREEKWTGHMGECVDPTGNPLVYQESTSGALTLSQTLTHNPSNQLTKISTSSGMTYPAYDQAGNASSLPKANKGALMLSCTYDAWNRLLSTSDGTTTLASYSYDGLGRRTEKLTASGTTDYYLDDQQVVETDYTPSGGGTALQYQYVWSPRGIDAAILRDDFTAAPLYPRLYYLNDANMNVTAVVGYFSGAWEPVERYVYSGYGVPTFYDGNWCWIASSLVNNSVLYTGQERDAENGLYCYRARYYSPSSGRFVGRDPLGADINLYAYCGDGPANGTDPSGMANIWNPFSYGTQGTSNPWDFWLPWRSGLLSTGGGLIVGAGRGVVNIGVGLKNTGKEVSLQVYDTGAGALEIVGNSAGADWQFETQSNLGQAALRPDFSYGTHVVETGANFVSVGTYGEVKAGYQLYKGEITVDQASQAIGSTAVLQAVAARGLARQPGFWNNPIPGTPELPGVSVILGRPATPVAPSAPVSSTPVGATKAPGATPAEPIVPGFRPDGSYVRPDGTIQPPPVIMTLPKGVPPSLPGRGLGPLPPPPGAGVRPPLNPPQPPGWPFPPGGGPTNPLPPPSLN